ncbi:MAG: acetyl-CoA carboxylase, carboxyltransferase subunit beta [Planctomycetota bacterium]
MSDTSMAKDDPKPAPGDNGAAEDAPREARRWRFRKKELPGGLWLKCENCGATIFRKEVVAKGYTCPACGFHFTMPGQDRVRHTIDEGSWDELHADLTAMDRLHFVDSGPYSDKIERTVKRTGQNEALIAGRGAILGRPVVLAVLDFKFLGGSMGEVVGEKIALACDVARLERRPLVLFTASGGARMHEGMLSLMQMAKTSAALSRLNEEGGFSICVLTHPTTGGVTASFAMVCDLTLAEPGALIGFAGPRVIASTIKQELPEGFQRAEFLLEKGQIDAIVHRDEMRERLAMLLDFGTSAWPKPEPSPQEDAEEAADEPAEAQNASDGEGAEVEPEPDATDDDASRAEAAEESEDEAVEEPRG